MLIGWGSCDAFDVSTTGVVGWEFCDAFDVSTPGVDIEEPCTFCDACNCHSTLERNMAPPQDEAYEESQKYKEGKVVIEKAMMVRCW